MRTMNMLEGATGTFSDSETPPPQAATKRHSTVSARNVARPRQVAMYLAKQLTSRSLPEIGRKLALSEGSGGGRDEADLGQWPGPGPLASRRSTLPQVPPSHTARITSRTDRSPARSPPPVPAHFFRPSAPANESGRRPAQEGTDSSRPAPFLSFPCPP